MWRGVGGIGFVGGLVNWTAGGEEEKKKKEQKRESKKGREKKM